MKALLLYTGESGRRDFGSQLPEVRSALASVFSAIDVDSCPKDGDLARISAEKAALYDAYIVAGGDGTFNTVISALAPLEKTPVLGFINFGTLGDVGKNFGVSRSLKGALEIIKKGRVKSIDIGSIGDSYFAYVAAFGCYSDIAYSAKRNSKKRWGKAAYYSLAAKSAMKSAKYAVRYVVDGRKETRLVPFLMVMNGTDIGGFRVNRKSAMDDGYMELFLPKKAPFNGLAQTLLRPYSEVIRVSAVDIEPLDAKPWCLDGELGPVGKVRIAVLPKRLKVYTAK